MVIGNPPYIRQENLTSYKSYLAATYPQVYHGVADIFIFFFSQGLRQAIRGGRLSYISSNSWLRANYAAPLRHFLRTMTTIDLLIDLGDNHVFKEAPDVYPAIHIARNTLPPEGHKAQVAVFTHGEGVQPFEKKVDEKLFPVSIFDQPDSGWQLTEDASRRLFAKLKANGIPLEEMVGWHMHYGVKTGFNEAFIIDQNTRDRLIQEDKGCRAILKKIYRGEDLRPWYQEDEGHWLLAIPNGWTRKTFGADLSEEEAWQIFSARHPSLATHLASFADTAQKRSDKGEYWWELRACDYYDEFEQPKIMWPDIAKFPRFSWDETGSYIGNTGYILVADKWLLSHLSSRCAWFLIMQISKDFGERAGALRFRLIDQYMKQIPIRKFSLTHKSRWAISR